MERNESQDIIEWLLYHIAFGFEHFVVYDHSSEDDTLEKLRPFVDLGWVTLVQYSRADPWAQPLSFESFVADWKQHSKWLFFFDVDEFVARNDTLLVRMGEDKEPFNEWFEETYGSYGGVALPRLSFTSNGHYERPGEGVLAAYTEARTIDSSFYVPKIIAQARFMKPHGSIHEQAFDDLPLVDPLGKSGTSMWEDKGDYPVYLHHYWSKDFASCLKRSKQKAFPDSWREKMGDRFCRLEMPMTDDYAEIEHLRVSNLVKFSSPIRIAAERFERRHPTFSVADFRLSVLAPETSSRLKRPAEFASELSGGTVLVIDSQRSDLGRLEVVLSSKNSKRYLPVTYRTDGSASFKLPPASTGNATSYELRVVRQYASSPDPERGPVSPCLLVGHLVADPQQPQLLRLSQGRCKDGDLNPDYALAAATWPHSHLRGELLFRRFVKLKPSSAKESPLPATPPPLPPLPDLGRGEWKSYPLSSFRNPTLDSPSRLYTSERCPAYFSAGFWDRNCGNEAKLAKTGVLRWVPDGASTHADIALAPSELATCVGRSTNSPRPRRIVIVGDSVASHTYMALKCLFAQAGLPEHEHLRYHSFHYEMFDLADGLLDRDAWERFFAWEFDEAAQSARTMPDVVVLRCVSRSSFVLLSRFTCSPSRSRQLWPRRRLVVDSERVRDGLAAKPRVHQISRTNTRRARPLAGNDGRLPTLRAERPTLRDQPTRRAREPDREPPRRRSRHRTSRRVRDDGLARGRGQRHLPLVSDGAGRSRRDAYVRDL